MPRIFDNIDQRLLPALTDTLDMSDRADFCVGYFNLRGWKQLDACVERWSGGPESQCRLLVGMQRLPAEEVRHALGDGATETAMDNQTAVRLKQRMAAEFRDQLMAGAPTNQDEAGLRRLARQIRDGKVVVRLFLRHALHAKLYLLFRPDPVSPLVGYLGSSNLTLAGLSHQGELNVDVLDQDACAKLARWFEDRWNDRWCLDVSDELCQIIEESWAREHALPPYHIYLKMAYHLSQEARAGMTEFRVPRDFGNELFEFQVAAVKIASHHLNRRGGVLIGDVVGLGKTLMATAVARMIEDDLDLETLIICPKNLVPMWEDYRSRYRLRAKVVPLSQVEKLLPELRPYRVVLIDESHNLRNREGRRYRVIHDYIRAVGSKVILLSATPYNKSYVDLANQLRLFLPEDQDVGIRPERLLRDLGETEFVRKHQCGVRTLAAFEKSEYADDWRELMRLYLVRRTRTFIQANYAAEAPDGRRYLTFADGSRSYFPVRQPRTLEFPIDEADPLDQYAQLYADNVVHAVNDLTLPRYGLANYLRVGPRSGLSEVDKKTIADLSRAGKRLMGFCRTNLFKRLESSGQAFLLSVERHILRNEVYLHALSQGLPVPIGTQDAGLLDTRVYDEDSEWFVEDEEEQAPGTLEAARTAEDYRQRAAEVYRAYDGPLKRRFRWLPAAYFRPELAEHLHRDTAALVAIRTKCGQWQSDRDAKLSRLLELLTDAHRREKVLVFSQFADTVDYLVRELQARSGRRVAGVTGDTPDPSALSWRFSPVSNDRRKVVAPDNEVEVLVCTDVLSEGQNLQDAHVVVNYDLPWAIIRLIQRAGRVDRIGQHASEILCYSFLPADGVERIIRLRARVRQRLRENAEVVGTDEFFFDDDANDQAVRDLFTEKTGMLDGEEETEVDLGSFALQIWQNALKLDPSLDRVIPNLPNVVFATKPHRGTPGQPNGVLVYVRTAQDYDALTWVDKSGASVTESQYAILRGAECGPETPALDRQEDHHVLVEAGVAAIAAEERSVGGQLGRPSGARFRTYERLKRHAEEVRGTLFDTKALHLAIEDIYRSPLRAPTTDTLNRLLRSGVSDEELARRVIELRDEDRLCVPEADAAAAEPRIICSLGLAGPTGAAGQ